MPRSLTIPRGLRLEARWLCVLGVLVAGCEKKAERPIVTLYCSVDEPLAREVVAVFEKQSGVQVRLRPDTESGKTTSLVRLIEAERSRPQADVFWSSELFNTIWMAGQGLLAEYRPATTKGIPERYRDPGGRWVAFGLRARVLAYNTGKLRKADVPGTWRGIADARWKGRLGVADPRFGTTRGHFAAMYVLWGEPAYVQFLDDLKATIGGRLLDGNATSAALVGGGELSLGATDTDDVYARQVRGEPIELTYPDMGDGGTLLIPNSVGLVAGAPHGETARQLIDFLASERVERMLAASDSRNIPVRASLRGELKLTLPPESKLDFTHIAASMDRAIALAGEHLISGK